MLFDERETRHIRIWGETHPHLGGSTSVSGRRHIRIWEKMRLCPEQETTASET